MIAQTVAEPYWPAHSSTCDTSIYGNVSVTDMRSTSNNYIMFIVPNLPPVEAVPPHIISANPLLWQRLLGAVTGGVVEWWFAIVTTRRWWQL